MRHIRSFLLSLSILLLFAGCVSTKRDGNVWVTDDLSVSLLPPSAITRAIDSYDELTGSFEERTFTVETWSLADSTRIEITVMSPTGQTIATIRWDGVTASATTLLQGFPFSPAYVLFDWQLIYCDASAVAAFLAPYGLAFTETATEEGTEKTLKRGEDVLYDIRMKEGVTVLENKVRGYAYTLRGGEE